MALACALVLFTICYFEAGTNVYEEITGRITHIELGEMNSEKDVVTGNEVTENGRRVVKVIDFIYMLKD